MNKAIFPRLSDAIPNETFGVAEHHREEARIAYNAIELAFRTVELSRKAIASSRAARGEIA